MTTRVLPVRVGNDIVRSIFNNVKVHCVSSSLIITVSPGAVVGDTDGDDTLTTTTTVTIDGSTSGANGLDTGAFVSNTWYYIWLIKEPGGVVQGLLSASNTSPTMPSGYTLKRRIGSVLYRNGTDDFYGFEQVGKRITYESAREVYGPSNMPTSTWVTISLSDVMPLTGEAGYFQVSGPFSSSELYLGYTTATHFVANSGSHGTDRQKGDGHIFLNLPTRYVYAYRTGYGNQNPVEIFLSSYEDGVF